MTGRLSDAQLAGLADSWSQLAAGTLEEAALRELQQAREALREARRLAVTEKDHVWTADDACEQIAAVADAALGGRS